MSKYSFTLDSFKNIQDLIRFIDQKSSAILVIYGFVLTAYVNNANKLYFVNPFILPFWKAVVSILTLLVGIASLCLLLHKIHIIINHILRPRLASNYESTQLSLFYYEHINRLGKERYMIEIENLNEDQAEKEIAAQVFEISTILTLKTKNLNLVMTRMFYVISLVLIFIFLTQLL